MRFYLFLRVGRLKGWIWRDDGRFKKKKRSDEWERVRRYVMDRRGRRWGERIRQTGKEKRNKKEENLSHYLSQSVHFNSTFPESGSEDRVPAQCDQLAPHGR